MADGRSWLIGLAVLGVGAVGAWGCNIYTDALLDPDPSQDGGAGASAGTAGSGAVSSGGSAGSTAGGTGGTGGGTQECAAGSCWWNVTTPEGCTSYSAPGDSGRPTGTAAGDVGAFYMAIDQLWLGESAPVEVLGEQEPWAFYGFDLDGLCTNPIACLSAPDNQFGCISGAGIPFDGHGCIDNMFGRLEPVAATDPTLGPVFGIGEEPFNCELHRGGFTVLIKVTGYNGEPDDEQVRLDFYFSPGLSTPRTWDCTDELWRDQAPWISIEKWNVARSTLGGAEPTGGQLPPSTVFVENAYVRQGYVVGKLPDETPVRFIGDNSAVSQGFTLRFHQATFTANVSRTMDGLWEASDGIIAGRVTRDNLLKGFHEIGFCEGRVQSYDLLTNYLLANMDVLSSGANDTSLECDAMSVAIAFTARQASPGDAVDASELVECPPEDPN